MNTTLDPFRPALLRAAFLSVTVLLSQVRAQDAAPLSARDIAARLSVNVQDGSSFVRLKLEIHGSAGGPKTVLQLQVKARRTARGTDLVYQVIWPKERKGESFLLRKAADRAPSGAVFVPPDSLLPISSSKMKNAVFGSNLTYEDLLENFFAWEHQTIVGTEIVDRVPCQILESRPGKSDRSTSARVRSWIDLKRFVPLRVEKYLESGQLVRRIDTTRVAKDDTDRLVPASLSVRRQGQDSVTELEGSNSRHDVSYLESDFTPDALRTLSIPGSKPK
jgi:Outer membrane lipoprotein-sorting protein